MEDKVQDTGEDAIGTQHKEQNGEKKPRVGQNMAAIRRLRGISQEYVAIKLGKSQQTVSNIEAMDDISEDLLAEIAKILGVTPEYIKNYDLERVIFNNTQIVNEGGNGGFNIQEFNANTTNSLDVIKYIVAENDRLHAHIIKEKDAMIRDFKAEIRCLKADIKRLSDELQEYKIAGSKRKK